MADAFHISRTHDGHGLPALHGHISHPHSKGSMFRDGSKRTSRKDRLLNHPHVVRPCSDGTTPIPLDVCPPAIFSTQWSSVPVDLDQHLKGNRKGSQGSTSSSGFSSLNRRKGSRRSKSKRSGDTLSNGKLPSLTSTSSNTTHSSLDENQQNDLIRPLSALSVSRPYCSLASLDLNQRWLNSHDRLHQHFDLSRTVESFADQQRFAERGAVNNDKFCYSDSRFTSFGTKHSLSIKQALELRPESLSVMSRDGLTSSISAEMEVNAFSGEGSGHKEMTDDEEQREPDGSDGPTGSYSPISPIVSPSSRAILVGQSDAVVRLNVASPNSTPLPPPDSPLNDSSLLPPFSNDSKHSLSSSTLIAAATTPSGELDFDRLRIILSAQRKAFNDQLSVEKAKREALQELLLELNGAKSNQSTSRSRRRHQRPPSQALSDDHDSAARKALVQNIEARLYNMALESGRNDNKVISITVENADHSAENPNPPISNYDSMSAEFGYNLPIQSPGDSQLLYGNGKPLYKSFSSTNITSALMQTPSVLENEIVGSIASGSDSSVYASTSATSSSASSHDGSGLLRHPHYVPPLSGRRKPTRSVSQHILAASNGWNAPTGLPQLTGNGSNVSAAVFANTHGNHYSLHQHPRYQQRILPDTGARTGRYAKTSSSKQSSPKRSQSKSLTRASHSRRHYAPVGWYADIAQDGVPQARFKSSVMTGVKVRSFDIKSAPSLQDSLEKRKPNFIASSKARLQRIAAARYIRHTADRQMRELAEEVAAGRRTMPQGKFLHILAQSQTSAFPVDEMVRDTRRRYRKLPEYQQRMLDQRRAFNQSTNRVLAKMYKQRILYNVLRTEQRDLPYSKQRR